MEVYECPGCEIGCEFESAHLDDWGDYHSACCTRAAEIARISSDTITEQSKDIISSPRKHDSLEPNNYIILYIKEYMIGNYAQEYINYYNSCNCCETHQVLKPNRWGPWNDYRVPTRVEKKCKCNCRFMTRLICHLYPDNY
jgi:hypothetical protein